MVSFVPYTVCFSVQSCGVFALRVVSLIVKYDYTVRSSVPSVFRSSVPSVFLVCLSIHVL